MPNITSMFHICICVSIGRLTHIILQENLRKVVEALKDQQQPMIDWDEFEKHMIKQFPFMSGLNFPRDAKQYKDLGENYVQETMKRFFSSSMYPDSRFNPFAMSGIDYDLFETHRNIFVQCRLPKEASPVDMNFSVNKRKLKIAYSGKTEEVKLPNDVDPVRSSANYKDGILEIRMPKSRDRETFHDIVIRN